ncbi:MAG: DUF998 domain-containing protein [Candidatus Diapherotrites archaeon]|nr:DUF998 domain-containing protein [Candidatus Diapherotrites archaeon]
MQLQRLSGLLGILGIIAFLAFTAIAVLNFPNYDFAGQFLSELGIGAASAFWFNSGLVIAGICFAVFFARFWKEQKAIAIAGILASLALAGIGIFPMNQEPMHNIAAGLFFFLAGIAALFFSKQNRKDRLLFAVSFLALIADIAYLGVQSPILQKISVALFLAWVLFVSLKK